MKDDGDTVLHTKNDNSPEIKPTLMEDCDVADRKFKIIVVKKLNELQKSSERKFSGLRNTSKQEQKNILKMKKINEMKSVLESIGNRVDHIEE